MEKLLGKASASVDFDDSLSNTDFVHYIRKLLEENWDHGVTVCQLFIHRHFKEIYDLVFGKQLS